MQNKNIIKLQLQQAISQAVKKVTGLNLSPEKVFLEHPEKEEFGDYSTNIAMTLFGRMKKNQGKSFKVTPGLKKRENGLWERGLNYAKPADLAKAIVEELKNNLTIQQFNNITIVNNFINLSINNEWLVKEMYRVLMAGSDYIKLDQGKNKQIMVEFSHPNTHKAFHIGHLRNISTGEAVVRILEANGYKVVRANYQGDVGIHIAKCLWGILQDLRFKIQDSRKWTLEKRAKFMGEAYVVGSDAYDKNEKANAEIKDINYLIYAAAQQYQQKVHHIQPGSTDYMKFVKGKKFALDKIYELWVETRRWSLDYFDNIYKRVYSHFDKCYFESQCLVGVDKSYEALKKGVLKRSQGAVVFDGKPYGLDTRVFINSLGLPTYEGKELGLAPMEFSDWGHLERIIHVVTPEQTSFFKITFKVEELLSIQKDQQYHLAYNWVKLKKGKMSSRLGNVVLGEWLLDEAKAKIKKEFPKLDEATAEMIAVGAVKYSFLKPTTSSEISFDFDESVSLEGNSGPYLQYTYARCQSVLAKAGADATNNILIYYKQANEEELRILRWMYRFPEVVEQAGKTYSPNVICNFLYELAQRYNTFYNKHRILESQISNLKSQNQNLNLKSDQSQFRLALTAATAQVLKDGLYLLGIKTPCKM